MNFFLKAPAYMGRFATFAVLGLSNLMQPVLAVDWAPTRPIKMIIPSTPGGGADITGRLLSEQLALALGQPVIVDNKGGAAGLIGTEAAATSAPDGYTMVLGSDYAFTIYPQLRKPPYDPIKDFEPIGLVANLPMLLVVNSRMPVSNVKELLAFAKANPGKLTMASGGNGSSPHLASEYLKFQAGVNMLHVPYRGAAEAMTSVLSGETDMFFVSPATALPHIKSSKVKALGVSTAQRVPLLPDLPTLAEAGVNNFDIGIWFGLFYPARTPKPIVDRVNAELQKILAKPEVRARFAEMGYATAGGKPELLGQRLATDTVKYRTLVQDASIKLDQ